MPLSRPRLLTIDRTYLAEMPRFYPIKVECDERTVRGEWTLCQGSRICVRAPGYGPSLIVPCGGRKPHVYAPIVLRIMVRCFFRREAAELARQAREARRLGGRKRIPVAA